MREGVNTRGSEEGEGAKGGSRHMGKLRKGVLSKGGVSDKD